MHQALDEYSSDRGLALAAVVKNIANGARPDRVASVIIAALTDRTPRLSYPGGREAKLLTLLKKFAPQRFLDKGLRKQFGLAAG